MIARQVDQAGIGVNPNMRVQAIEEVGTAVIVVEELTGGQILGEPLHGAFRRRVRVESHAGHVGHVAAHVEAIGENGVLVPGRHQNPHSGRGEARRESNACRSTRDFGPGRFRDAFPFVLRDDRQGDRSEGEKMPDRAEAERDGTQRAEKTPRGSTPAEPGEGEDQGPKE